MQQTDIQRLKDIAAVATTFVQPRRCASMIMVRMPGEESATAFPATAHVRLY